ncbi:hypothetical protein pdam_00012094 [Pocillopora damicornis]|uniref:EGF-like domain-containing protein n=1 Tax=Pocillopora damicornis TaxID=46731 RepID=A0A3M6URE6_POCDA|nr:hypothetical protein pdam_00012094 [Pocillopora damicornis]
MERFKVIFQISALQILFTIAYEQRRKSLASFRPDHLYQTFLSSTHQIHSKLTLFYLSAVSVPVTVPDPVAVFPLNSKYQTREIESRVPQGNPVSVSLADGPDGKAGGSYAFAGSAGNYIEFPNNGALDVQYSITMLCWVYPTGKDGPLFNYKRTGSWGVHLWVVFGQLLWVDGRQTAQSNIGRVHLSTQNEVRMGVKDGDIRYFQGRIAAMQLYNVALTAEQINVVKKVGLADACDELKPCKNGATCSTSGDGYTCSCVQGFRGTNCEHGIDIDECQTSNPCQNGGQCENTHGSYECKCKSGFTGRNCDTDINECQISNPCKNGGQCENTHGSYECKCTPGFTGRNCETDIDECQTSKPCQNGGQCENTHGSYKCICKPGFTGKNCETVEESVSTESTTTRVTARNDSLENSVWEKQGCFKEVKKKNKAMGKVLGKFRKYKKNIKGAVEACMKAAKGKKLEIFGVRGKFSCATTKGNADYNVHGASPKGCKEEGDHGVGLMFVQTKSPVRMEENAEALVTATPVLVLKDSREKIAKMISMNAKPQIHAKIADYAKTHMEAMNANARLDLQEEIAKQVPCADGGTCVDGINSYTCDCTDGYVGKYCEWEKQGCFKEVKKKSKKAMRTTFAIFKKYKNNIQGAVEACMKAAEDKKLEIFGVRGRYKCVTTKGNADYKVHGASPKGCKADGDYGVGVKSANYVYILTK